MLAPLALVAVVIALFSAVGKSCALRNCESETATTSQRSASADAKSTSSTGAPVRVRQRYKVQPNDTAQSIAAKFDLTEEELRDCNPQVEDFYNLQVDQFLNIAQRKCKQTKDTDI